MERGRDYGRRAVDPRAALRRNAAGHQVRPGDVLGALRRGRLQRILSVGRLQPVRHVGVRGMAPEHQHPALLRARRHDSARGPASSEGAGWLQGLVRA